MINKISTAAMFDELEKISLSFAPSPRLKRFAVSAALGGTASAGTAYALSPKKHRGRNALLAGVAGGSLGGKLGGHLLNRRSLRILDENFHTIQQHRDKRFAKKVKELVSTGLSDLESRKKARSIQKAEWGKIKPKIDANWNRILPKKMKGNI
jgi:hypothetical protein